jgi:hypothetical protein
METNTGYLVDIEPEDPLTAVSISDVWRMLGGEPIENGKARAWWQGDPDRAVSIDDRTDRWHDTGNADGGGILELVAIVRGCSPADAALWIEDELNLAVWTAIVTGDVSLTGRHGTVGDAA